MNFRYKVLLYIFLFLTAAIISSYWYINKISNIVIVEKDSLFLLKRTDSQKEIIKQLNFKKIKKTAPNILEIGFGMGHNLIELSKNNLNSQIIGIEPFINGVVSVIYSCVKQNIDNILVYPDPVEKFLEKYKKIYFKEIFILFPDPWHKKKHHKRRLVQLPFLKNIVKRLDKNGKLYFATDNQDYFESVQDCLDSKDFKKIPIVHKKIDVKHLGQTKYFLRAKKLGNKVNFLVIVKS